MKIKVDCDFGKHKKRSVAFTLLNLIILIGVFTYLQSFYTTSTDVTLLTGKNEVMADAVKVNESFIEPIRDSIAECEDVICVYDTIYFYTLFNVNQTKDEYIEEILFMNNDPEYTLENGGDCENMAILIASMIKSAHVQGDVYLVGQKGHACIMVRNRDQARFYNCFDDEPILAVTEVNIPSSAKPS